MTYDNLEKELTKITDLNVREAVRKKVLDVEEKYKNADKPKCEATAIVYAHFSPQGIPYIGFTSETNTMKGYDAMLKRAGLDGVNYADQAVYKGKTDKGFKGIAELGFDAFAHIVLIEGISRDDAIKFEKECIAYFDAVENGFNCNIGCDYIRTTNDLVVLRNIITREKQVLMLADAAAYLDVSIYTIKNCALTRPIQNFWVYFLCDKDIALEKLNEFLANDTNTIFCRDFVSNSQFAADTIPNMQLILEAHGYSHLEDSTIYNSLHRNRYFPLTSYMLGRLYFSNEELELSDEEIKEAYNLRNSTKTEGRWCWDIANDVFTDLSQTSIEEIADRYQCSATHIASLFIRDAADWTLGLAFSYDKFTQLENFSIFEDRFQLREQISYNYNLGNIRVAKVIYNGLRSKN